MNYRYYFFYHPLHPCYSIALYFILLFFSRNRIAAVGLLFQKKLPSSVTIKKGDSAPPFLQSSSFLPSTDHRTYVCSQADHHKKTCPIKLNVPLEVPIRMSFRFIRHKRCSDYEFFLTTSTI